MKGSKIRWENFKSGTIAVLLGFLAATGIPWSDTVNQIIGGYIVAQCAWVFLITYDEIQRQRDEFRRRKKRRLAE